MIQFGGGQPPAIPNPWARTLGQLSDMQTASVIRTYNWPWFWSQVAQYALCWIAEMSSDNDWGGSYFVENLEGYDAGTISLTA